jgi:hypothetical protein
MATNAAMERNIKDRASLAFHSSSQVEPEPGVEPEPESEASDIRRKSELIEELVNTTAVGILIQRDRTTMRKETGVNGVNIFRIHGRARQAFSFLKTQSYQLHAVKNGKCSTSWNVRRCRLRKQHILLLKRKQTAMKWGVRAMNV